MSRKILVNINTWDKLKKFAQIVSNIESDVNIYNGSGYYDAKSIMAIIALDMSKTRYIEIVSDNEEEIKRFNEVMEEFK